MENSLGAIINIILLFPLVAYGFYLISKDDKKDVGEKKQKKSC